MIQSKQSKAALLVVASALVLVACQVVAHHFALTNASSELTELDWKADRAVETDAPIQLKSIFDGASFNKGLIQQVVQTVDLPQPEQPSSRIKTLTEQLKSGDSGLPPEAEMQLSKVLSNLRHQRADQNQQANAIQQLIAQDAAKNSDRNHVIDLPAICMSDLAGWPEPEFQRRTQQVAAQQGLDTGHHPIPNKSAPKKLSTKELLKSLTEEAGQPEPGERFSMPMHQHQPNARQPLELDEEAIRNYNPHANASAAAAVLKPGIDPAQFAGKDPHADIYANNPFPSAVECKKCHEQIFDEWSVSGHAYAAISPMFHKFEQKLNDLSQGTIGYFCMRCHAPVATTMKHRRDMAIWEGPRVFREGVTCVACHRVKESYGKVNGERRMEPGGITEPVYGSSDGKGVEEVIQYRDNYKVKTDPDDKGIGEPIHRRAIQFEELSNSTFCVSCHQVAVDPGIKLEVVWDQYRASPAYREGTSCQDCHMGKVPGVNAGYSVGPAALVNGMAVRAERRHSNHSFYGPGYSIAHPGIFPQNPEADRWTVDDWLQFDWRAGWGTEDFEIRLLNGESQGQFPPVWANIDDRYDARDVIEANIKKLKYKKDLRRQVMENGSKVNGPFFSKPARIGKPLNFSYQVCNTNRGHNMPSGSLGAQPQLWLNVVLIGPTGQRLWESGYQDSQGDIADIHSQDVLDGKIPRDRQLFNLQTKFLITNVKGTDREVPLPLNWDIDQLPFIRPGVQPISNINHPPFIRMEGHSIPPLGSRNARYRVPAGLITQPGTYRLSVRLRSRAEPIYFMRYVGATAEMMRSMNERMVDAHPYTVAFEVK